MFDLMEPDMKRLTIPSLGVLAVAALVLAAVFSFTSEEPPADVAAVTTTVPHYRTADVRIRITDGPVVSRNQDPVYVELDSGVIPSDVSLLRVLTDENCTPDEQGVSHCLNRVEYATASGMQTAALRHHHNMAEEPCLTPGQTLEIVR